MATPGAPLELRQYEKAARFEGDEAKPMEMRGDSIVVNPRRAGCNKYRVTAPRTPSDRYKEFIDVDVMKHMADLSSKPKRVYISLWQGVIQGVFLPFFPTYWVTRQQIGALRWALLAGVWVCQVLALGLHAHARTLRDGAFDDIPVSEVLFPIGLTIFVALVYGRVPVNLDKHRPRVPTPPKQQAPRAAAAKTAPVPLYPSITPFAKYHDAGRLDSQNGLELESEDDDSESDSPSYTPGSVLRRRRAVGRKVHAAYDDLPNPNLNSTATVLKPPADPECRLEGEQGVSVVATKTSWHRVLERRKDSPVTLSTTSVKDDAVREAHDRKEAQVETFSSDGSLSSMSCEQKCRRAAKLPRMQSIDAPFSDRSDVTNDDPKGALRVEGSDAELGAAALSPSFVSSHSVEAEMATSKEGVPKEGLPKLPSSFASARDLHRGGAARATRRVSYSEKAPARDRERAASPHVALQTVDSVPVLLWFEVEKDEGEMPSSPGRLRQDDDREDGPVELPFKVSMRVLDIRTAIIASVEHHHAHERVMMLYLPSYVALMMSAFPSLCRAFLNYEVAMRRVAERNLDANSEACISWSLGDWAAALWLAVLPQDDWDPGAVEGGELGWLPKGLFVVLSSAVCMFVLVRMTVNQLRTAQAVHRRRYLYAKFFSALTSLRRSRRHNLPHFRLKNVENVMAWLTLRGSRAWLRLEHREIAADSIVSLTFQLFLIGVAAIGMMVLHDRKPVLPKSELFCFSEVFQGQVFISTLIISYFLLQYMLIGMSINQKYGNASLLLTEQLNIHLRMASVSDRMDSGDPKAKAKKERLQLTAKVLDLAAKLLKELEGPNKISGLAMNPLLYNITRVMVLSCLSAAISHVFGFTPKLMKI